MKIDIIIEKIDNELQSSFWYQYDGDIAIISDKDKKIIITTCGEIRVKLSNENFYRKNQQAVHQALLLNLIDNDLNNIEFDECNWFDFLYCIDNENFIGIDGDECFFYDDSIEMAIRTINNKEFWKQF